MKYENVFLPEVFIQKVEETSQYNQEQNVETKRTDDAFFFFCW